MNKKVCPRCKSNNEIDRFFCRECGSFLEKGVEPEAYVLPEMKVMRIVDNLRHMKPSEQVPDEAFAYVAEKAERLQALFSLPEFVKNAQVSKDIKDFLSLCRHPDFQIAFVGTIKTGKSTLINALLGKNYASMAVTPETAALTKFRFSPRDYVQVTFYTSDEWNQLWASRKKADKYMEEYVALNAESQRSKWVNHAVYHRELSSDEVEDELSKWSSSKSPEHYFVKEIEVGISTLPKDFPPQVVFVDTPGLFDPVAYRSELTKQYIDRANAVFMCVDAQKVQQPEIETISSVFSICSGNKEKVYIVATHWDKLNNPEEDWKEQKQWLTRQLTGKGFFDTREAAETNIMSTAAYIHILCRDYESLDKSEIKGLKKFALDYDYDVDDIEDRRKMEQKANIQTVFSIIRDKLAGNYRKLLQEEIESRFGKIRHDLGRIAKETKVEAQGRLSDSKQSLQDLKATVETKRQNYEKIKNVTAQLNAVMDQVEQRTVQSMMEICNKLKSKVEPKYKPEQIQKSWLRSQVDKFLRI